MIKRMIPERSAGYVMVALFSLILIFHLMVIAGIIPYHIVWGGRLKSKEEMFVFEIVSIFLNTCMMIVVSIRSKLWRISINQKLLSGILWGMALLFAINTVGNLFAISTWETIVFTPITLILALLSLRLALA